MILEDERRWDDFQGGMPIVLPDGGTWHFYEPAAKVRAGRPGWTFGEGVAPDLDAILSGRLARILAKLGRATSDGDRAAAILEAAWFLLARNYRITRDEFEGILSGASAWSDDDQIRLGGQLQGLVGVACARSTALMGVA